MTYEEILQRNQIINQRLDQISTLTANMALVGSAHSMNPAFIELMQAQENLIQKSEKLLDEIKNSSGL